VREVAGAVTASTITTVAVFAPIGLVGGLIGELFSSFAITVAASLLASLLVSLTVIPVFAYWFLRQARVRAGRRGHRTAEERERSGLLQRTYVPVLRFAIRRRLTTVIVGILVLLGTGTIAGGLKTNFFDQSGQNSLTITQRLPAGTSITTTDAAAQQVERIVAGMKEIKTYQVTIGGGGVNGDVATNCNQASFSLTVRDGINATAVQDRLRTSLAALSGAGDLKVSTGSSTGFSSDQLQVVVEADDDTTLAKATEQVRQAVTAVKGVVEVGSDLATTVPRVSVDLDRKAAGGYGFTDATVGEAVTAALRGSQLGQVTIDGTQQTLMLRLGTAPAGIEQIKALPLA
jgi:HAE1 family hydrophobic/amphiphilic exporter-1